MKQLVVGDPHVTVEDMADAQALMTFVEQKLEEFKPDELVILGDLHNNFAITNIRVTGFWRDWLKRFKVLVNNIRLIRGNHDMMGDGSEYPHALVAYEDLAIVVDKPWIDYFGGLYLPYYADPNLFLKEVANYPDIKMIFCHQEFNGAQYDNGFFAPNGVDPAAIHVPVISGHIHTPQTLESVWYPGAPRWRHLTDANIERAIYLIERPSDGTYTNVKRIDTGEACRRIWAWKVTEETPLCETPIVNAKDQYRFSIRGSVEFVKENEKKIRALFPHPIITTVVTDKVIRVRESDGIEVAFKKFVEEFQVKNGTSPAVLRDLAIKRLGFV